MKVLRLLHVLPRCFCNGNSAVSEDKVLPSSQPVCIQIPVSYFHSWRLVFPSAQVFLPCSLTSLVLGHSGTSHMLPRIPAVLHLGVNPKSEPDLRSLPLCDPQHMKGTGSVRTGACCVFHHIWWRSGERGGQEDLELGSAETALKWKRNRARAFSG